MNYMNDDAQALIHHESLASVKCIIIKTYDMQTSI